MTKSQAQIHQVYLKLQALNKESNVSDARALRRAALILHRWYEHECNGVIQRDEETNVPYWYNVASGKMLCKAQDRERGAEKRIRLICERLHLYYYLQTDPRGGTLYIDTKPIPDNNYTSAHFIA